MGSWGFSEWVQNGSCGIVAVLIAVDQAVLGMPGLLARLGRPLGGWRSVIPVIFICLACGSYALQLLRPASSFDLPKGYEVGTPFDAIQAWGVNNQVFYMVARAPRADVGNKLKRLVLVVQPIYANVDPMTDTSIKKSQAYTILDGFMTLAIPVAAPPVWRGTPGQAVQLRFSLVELPTIYAPEQIRSLADIETLGGRIISAAIAVMTMAAPPVAGVADSGCPAPAGG